MMMSLVVTRRENSNSGRTAAMVGRLESMRQTGNTCNSVSGQRAMEDCVFETGHVSLMIARFEQKPAKAGRVAILVNWFDTASPCP